jgi:hypothetical protein
MKTIPVLFVYLPDQLELEEPPPKVLLPPPHYKCHYSLFKKSMKANFDHEVMVQELETTSYKNARKYCIHKIKSDRTHFKPVASGSYMHWDVQ